MPALQKDSDFKFIGVGIASPIEWFGNSLASSSPEEIKTQQENEIAKAEKFIHAFGGKIFESYSSLVSSTAIDAIYLPLPPALHFKWANISLKNGKHVFVEKPATINTDDTKELISFARSKELALHENYMFLYHSQIKEIDEVISSGEIGDVRLYRISFGFPKRDNADFRYNKSLGGGVLIDAGGYTIKYADYLLGNTARVTCAQLNYIDGFNVDMFGSATMKNDKGETAQLSFGMDNNYKCELEIWGSKGIITTQRILTAPPDYTPTYNIKRNQTIEERTLHEDDTFFKSLQQFKSCINSADVRESNYRRIQRQADLIDQFNKIVTE